ncbi:nucleoside triphosphate pyrophosphohydrolase [Kribbella antibiotica]|uniref:nucleoside triphosphate pyrophosphohydrolase n=1 Tax=Kribbella antibiotica TaxID=190195 RepID=UPI001EE11ACA|nr:nucleoside triphosphate pyrophosphohydrolase [Kribbella antibiotica]
MTNTSKLVRDRIPEIVRSHGEDPTYYQADPAEYRNRLRAKLTEEVTEFLAATDDDAVEELADILEVVYALAADLGTAQPELDEARRQKATTNGAFAHRIIWTGTRG